MTTYQIEQYLLLLDRLLHIYSHNGIDWRPEYTAEIQKIERDLASLRETVKAQFNQYRQTEETDLCQAPEMVSINTASHRTGLSYSYIRTLLQDHKIPFVKSGSKYILNFDALTQYLNTVVEGDGK